MLSGRREGEEELACAYEQDATPEGVRDGKLPIVAFKYRVIGKVVHAINTHTVKEGLIRRCRLKEHVGKEEIDEDGADEADFDGLSLDEFNGATTIDATRQ